MTTQIVGIDPGQKGAICIVKLDSDASVLDISFELMPTIGKELDCHGLAEIFKKMGPSEAFIEKVSAMPKQGVASMFKFGRNVGSLQAMLAAFEIPYTEVTPQTWQKVMHEGVSRQSMPEPKDRSLAVVKRLFPKLNLLASERSRKAHDGFVDALLIAEYGRRKAWANKIN